MPERRAHKVIYMAVMAECQAEIDRLKRKIAACPTGTHDDNLRLISLQDMLRDLMQQMALAEEASKR